jgi:hypothetical protein
VTEPALWLQAIMIALPWFTIVLGTVVIMTAVAYQARGEVVGAGHATRVAIRWVPRYLWTNVHTSLIFWTPIGLLVGLRQWLVMAEVAAPEVVGGPLWWLAVIGLAVYLHTRTLLAPFLAVHADLPGTLAALEAWRLGGQRFLLCLATLAAGSLPVGAPLGLLALGVASSLSGSAHDAVLAAAPNLTWAGIQAVRPLLIPTLYQLYHELWHAEQVRPRKERGLAVPSLARAAVALTQGLPKWGHWE